jgi:hypothetical protein
VDAAVDGADDGFALFGQSADPVPVMAFYIYIWWIADGQTLIVRNLGLPVDSGPCCKPYRERCMLLSYNISIVPSLFCHAIPYHYLIK